MAASFIQILSGIDTCNSEEDRFDKEWNQFSEAIWAMGTTLSDAMGEENSEQFKELFSGFDTMQEKIKCMFDQEDILTEIQKVAEHLLLEKREGSQKDVQGAVNAFTVGEELFQQDKLEQAKMYYNKAILLADHDAQKDLMGKSFERRGQILYQTEHYGPSLHDYLDAAALFEKCALQEELSEVLSLKAECLKNVLLDYRVALSSNFEQAAGVKSLSPEAYEFEMAVKATYEWYTPTFHKNAKLPGASESVRMDYLPEKGRIIRANEAIPKGKVLFSENAFLAWLRPSAFNRYCLHCLKPIQNRFSPCRSCIEVRYCTSKCEETAWSQYHGVECNYLKALQYLSYAHVSLRLLIMYGVDNAIKISEEEPVDPSEWPERVFHADYKSFLSLVNEQMGTDFHHTFAFCCGIGITLILMEDMGLVKQDDEQFFKAGSLLLKHIFQINLNCYLLRDHKFLNLLKYDVIAHTPETIKVGIAVYLSSSLLSHSCDFNSYKYSAGAQSVMVSERVIAPEEEVTVSYCPYYVRMSVHDRRKFLREGYFFECECLACSSGWENVGYALRCPQCTGPLIWNEDNSNYCMHCASEGFELKGIWDVIEGAEKLLDNGRKALQEGKLKEAKKKLKLSKTALGTSYYSTCRQSNVKQELAHYYAKQKQFKKASKEMLEVIPLEKESCGKDSFEVINILLKTAHMLELTRSQSFRGIAGLTLAKKSRIRKLKEEAFEILQVYKEADARMVYLTYADFLHRLVPLVEGKTTTTTAFK